MLYIASTRFNNETLESNYKYRADKNIRGCIYGSCMMINEKYPINSLLFVIEMNNTQNKIEGIGLIKNRLILDKYYKIYEDGHYNRYTYFGSIVNKSWNTIQNWWKYSTRFYLKASLM